MPRIEFEREEDQRWIAEIPALPGVLVYGKTKKAARSKVLALARNVIAERIENGEDVGAATRRRRGTRDR